MIFQVLGRVVLSVSGNAVQKRLVLDGAQVSLTWLATYALMLLPSLALALALPVIAVDSSFWSNILLGGFLDAFGNLAMVTALRATDLSVFGPLNAFRPVLALLFGWVFLAEVPTIPGALGVATTVAGAILLLGPTQGKVAEPTAKIKYVLGLRILGLSLSTVGAVFLKRAANVASAEMTLCGWIVCGWICLVATALVRKDPGMSLLFLGFKRHFKWLLLHAGIFLVMQWLTIRIFQQTLLAYSFVYFQLGMALQVLVGKVLFSEPAFRKRFIACLIMAAGSALIFWKG